MWNKKSQHILENMTGILGKIRYLYFCEIHNSLVQQMHLQNHFSNGKNDENDRRRMEKTSTLM